MDTHPALKTLLDLGRTENATDIHVRPGGRVVLRFGRAIHDAGISVSPSDLNAIVESILDDPARGAIEKYGGATVRIADGLWGNIRIQVYLSRGTFALAIRLLGLTVPDADELGIPEKIMELAESETGIILISGPQKSAKTTTSHALVARMNQTAALPRHIALLEDVAEYQHEEDACIISQMTVGQGRDIRDLPTAIRMLLRADTQVMVTGEFRLAHDEANAIVGAAEAGCVVIANTHAHDPVRAIERLLDPFPPAEQHHARTVVANSLVASIGLRLAPRITGGFVLVTSLLYGTPAIAERIREGDLGSLRQHLSMHPNHTFEDSLKALRGEVDDRDAERVLRSVDPVTEAMLA